MEKNIFYNEIKIRCKEINVDITEEQSNKFYVYMQEIIEWNNKINLTAITDEKEIIVKHFIDSLSILKYTYNAKNMIDIGTGAGFPGIPIAIMNENISITLLDSLNKRVIFLNNVIDKLNLKNVKAIHGRAEEIAQMQGYRANYEIATSRAVAQLNILLEYMIPFCQINGTCICMKGSNIDEISEAKNSLLELGGEIKEIEKLYLGEEKMERNIILVNKIKQTPKKYPRKAGTPRKEPL